MTIQRLSDIEKVLELRYETLGEAEKDLAMTTDTFEITRIKQRLRERVLPDIRKYENEYWEVLRQEAEARSCALEEVEAENAIVEVVQVVERIEKQPNANYPEKIMQLLLEIRDTLNKPKELASARAKLALHLIPGILSYDFELDTQSALRRGLQPIKQMFKKAVDEGK